MSEHDEGRRGTRRRTTRRRPARTPPGEDEASFPTPRPAAPSVLQSVAPQGGWQAGVRLNELEDEPKLLELKQGAEKYSVHGVLGEGAMGKVYLARDEDLHRPVALKTSRRSDPEHLARFIAEAQVMGQLHHPGIVPVFELGQAQDGRLFYSMPVVRGQTLHDVVSALAARKPEATTRWSLTRLMQVFLQACNAVAYAHEKGVLHRDLKPSNIMAGRYGEVQVLDWGLAKVTRDSRVEVDLATLRRTDTGLVMGTPGYMSPEQARGEDADERSDVYSLGAILYELLTLRRTFEGSSAEVLAALLQQEPPLPRQIAPDRQIPLALEQACLKALEKRLSRRHHSVQSLADEVQTWLEGESDRVRRRQLADAKAAEARALLAELARLRGEVARLEVEAKHAATTVQGWQPLEEKEHVAAEDALEAARDRLVETSSRAVTTLTESLGFDPEHAAARELLADYHWDRLREAEAEGRQRDVRFLARLTASTHDGKYAHELRGDGSLELDSDPSGAEVWLQDFVEEKLLLQARNARLLGTTPLARSALPMGSYLVVLRKEGLRDACYPVYITRNKDWKGKVTLFTDEEIGAGFVHVPAGSFIAGGDPWCRDDALPRGEPWVDDFFMAVHPVTNAEYLEYLNGLADRGGLAAARARSPRRVPNEPATTYLVERGGRLVLPEADAEGDAWLPGHPACAISWHDAVAYCSWRSERDGREVHLPTELEWEKAARGVDGRWFPWGNRFDPSCCNMKESRRPGEDVCVAVEAMESRFPADVSVFGARGVGGNMRQWTATPGGEGRDTRVVRGGCWFAARFSTRVAFRALYEPSLTYNIIGFRLSASARRTRP